MTEITHDYTQEHARVRNILWWAVWIAAAMGLIATGFLLDGVTDTGHHLALIAGGITLGIKMGRRLL